MKWSAIGLVGMGSFFGGIARYLVGLGVTARFGTGWPLGTFIINISGCFMIGFFLTLASERMTIHEGWRLLFPIGFVGAYTTFSTYEYETARLIESGAWGKALSYLLASTVAGYAAVVAAFWSARRF
jgi:CrcB protein